MRGIQNVVADTEQQCQHQLPALGEKQNIDNKIKEMDHQNGITKNIKKSNKVKC